MERESLIKMFLPWAIISNLSMNNFRNIQQKAMCNGLNQEYGRNFQRTLIFTSTTLHNLEQAC